jgi:two-component system chemotaxis response regulator CheB
MVSCQTHKNAGAAIAALERGAFDCVGKPSSGEHERFGEQLLASIKAAAAGRLGPAQERGRAPPPAPRGYLSDGRVVAMGASTGGVEALIAILSHFPPNGPPTVITQHMPAAFTRTFAERLDRLCGASVREAFDGARLEPGHVYIAPGGAAHLRVEGASPPLCRLWRSNVVHGHRPSVDVLFRSVAEALGARSLGAILTGMGRDGAEGLLAMRNAGAVTVGQTESSCVIFGMPKAALQIGATQKQIPLHMMASEILRVTCAA